VIPRRRAFGPLFLTLCLPALAAAQGVEGRVGRFYDDVGWDLYRLGFSRPLAGPIAVHETHAPLNDVAPGTPTDWAEKFAVPAEKLGRLLVVEDALRAALRPALQV